jgi:hypothetical protein
MDEADNRQRFGFGVTQILPSTFLPTILLIVHPTTFIQQHSSNFWQRRRLLNSQASFSGIFLKHLSRASLRCTTILPLVCAFLFLFEWLLRHLSQACFRTVFSVFKVGTNPRHHSRHPVAAMLSVRHRCFIEFAAAIFSQRSDLIYVCRPPLQTRPCTRLHTLPTVGICLGAMSRNVGWCCIRIWAGCDASN